MKHLAFQLIALWILQRQYFHSRCSHTFGQEFVRHQSCFMKTLPRLSFCISHFYTSQSTTSRKESAFEEKQSQTEDWCGKGKCPKLFVLAVDSPGRAVQVSAALQCCWVCSVWEMQTEDPAAPWHSWDLPLPGFFIAIWALALLISHSPCLSRQDCGVGQKNNNLLWFFRERKKNNRDYFLFVIYLHLSLGVMILLPIQFWFQDDESPIESK